MNQHHNSPQWQHQIHLHIFLQLLRKQWDNSLLTSKAENYEIGKLTKYNKGNSLIHRAWATVLITMWAFKGFELIYERIVVLTLAKICGSTSRHAELIKSCWQTLCTCLKIAAANRFDRKNDLANWYFKFLHYFQAEISSRSSRSVQL